MTDRNDHGQFFDGFSLGLLLLSKYTTNLKDRFNILKVSDSGTHIKGFTIQVLYAHKKFISEYMISFEVHISVSKLCNS